MPKTLLQECIAKAPNTEAGVKSYIEIVAIRYRAVRPPSDLRIVQCNWRVRYFTKADMFVTLYSIALGLVSGVLVEKYSILRFQTYHTLQKPDINAYIKRVNTRKKRRNLFIFLSMLSGIGSLFIGVVTMWLFLSLSWSMPRIFQIEYELGIAITGFVSLLCLAFSILSVKSLYSMAFWDIPPNTGSDLIESNIMLEKVSVLQVLE